LAVFTYEALNPLSGEKSKGELESPSYADAVKLLEEKKLLALKCKEKTEIVLFERKPKANDLIQFFQIMGTMLESGLPILTALQHAGRNAKGRTLKRTLNVVSGLIQEGLSFSEAMEKHRKVFPAFVTEPVKVAETTGRLPRTLLAISEQLKKRREINSKVKRASIYPGFIAIFLLILIVIALNFVLPKVVGSIKQVILGTKMPPITSLVMSVSDVLSGIAPYLPVFFGLSIIGIMAGKRTRRGKELIDRIKLKIPHLKDIVLYRDIASFLRVSIVAIDSGLAMTKAVAMAENGVENSIVRNKIRRIGAMVAGGSLFSVAVGAVDLDPYIEAMAGAGEMSGTLDVMMKNSLGYYETVVNEKVETFFTFLEPITIAALGCVVAVVLLGSLLPLWESMQYVGKAG